MDEKSNIQHPTSNIQHRTEGDRRTFDLEGRLLDYAVRAVRLAERLPKTRAGNHIAKQFLRSATSPLPNHGEAQAAESPDDFIHKLRICLKELRESLRWLQLIRGVPLVSAGADVAEVDALTRETDELVRIFVASVRTAERNRSRRSSESRPQ
jgi:four helix bundle protein